MKAYIHQAMSCSLPIKAVDDTGFVFSDIYNLLKFLTKLLYNDELINPARHYEMTVFFDIYYF